MSFLELIEEGKVLEARAFRRRYWIMDLLTIV